MWQGGAFLEGTYEVFFGGKSIGKVQVCQEGLYLHFLCRCQLSGQVVCKLMVSCGKKQESLGILVPAGDGFGLETRLAARHLGLGELSFQVVPNRVVIPGQFVPIYPEEPFSYLARLKDAYLARVDGQVGAMIKEKAGT